MKANLTLADCHARLEALPLPVCGARPDLFLSATTKRRNLALGGGIVDGNRCGDHPLPPLAVLFVVFGVPGTDRNPICVPLSAN